MSNEERKRRAREHARRRRIENPEHINALQRSYRRRHPQKAAAQTLAWKRRNPEKVRGYALKFKFGINELQFEAMKAAQGHACAICHKPHRRRLCVDHDHATGQVRALLCMPCNTLVGFIEKRWRDHQAALDYIRSHAASAEATA